MAGVQPPPIRKGFLRGKFPHQRKMKQFYVEVCFREVRIYARGKDDVESRKVHLRSLIINDHDTVEEQQGKWYQKKKSRFSIARTDGTYIFECDSADECATWIGSLQWEQIQVAQSSRPVPPTPPQLDFRFHVPPEDGNDAPEDKSAYKESDWKYLVDRMWFWGYMNRGDCEKKLYNEGKMGDFVVRLNSNQQLVLSLWRQNGVQHFLIVLRGGSFHFQHAVSQSNRSCVEVYTSVSILI